MILCLLLNKNVYLCKVKYRNHIVDKSFRMKLNTLIAECTAYDFKVMLEEKKPKSWLKSVSAFSNGLGGSLFFGIDNDGIVKGLDNVQHVCEAISSRIRDYMDPLPEVEMIPHDIDGLRILQLKVNAGHYTPYYYVGDGQRIAFVRVGDESLPATAEQMVRLVLKGSNNTYDSLHTDYKAEDYSFTILANTFKDRTKQEWDKKYLLITEGRFFCYTIFFFSDVEIVTPNLPLPYMGGECLAGFPLEQASDNSRDFCYIDFVHQIPIS